MQVNEPIIFLYENIWDNDFKGFQKEMKGKEDLTLSTI